MKIDWVTVLTAAIAALAVMFLAHLLTTKKVDANTGIIKTSFLGFEGDKKDNMDGDEDGE